MRNPYVIGLVLILFVGAITGGLVAGGVFKTYHVKTPTYINREIVQSKQSYINPQPFKTGYLENSPQPIADVCNTSMYPIQNTYVDYGSDFNDVLMSIKNGGNSCQCDVNVFNSHP